MKLTNYSYHHNDGILSLHFSEADLPALAIAAETAARDLPVPEVPPIDGSAVKRLEGQLAEAKSDLAAAERDHSAALESLDWAFRDGTPPGEAEAAILASDARVAALKRRVETIGRLLPHARRDVQDAALKAGKDAATANLRRLEEELAAVSAAIVPHLLPHLPKALALRNAIRSARASLE